MKAPDPLPNKEVSFTGNHDPDLQKNKKKGFRKKEISQQGNQQDLSEILFLGDSKLSGVSGKSPLH